MIKKPYIFINYRREDSAGYVIGLYDRLKQHFGEDQIFVDVHKIELGEDFVDAIKSAVNSCDVFLAIIGKQWLTLADQYDRRRLDAAEDFVRLEIETALLCSPQVKVIPVLVHGANIPHIDGLPNSIVRLARRNACQIGYDTFHHDVDKLIHSIEITTEPHGNRSRSVIPRTNRNPKEITGEYFMPDIIKQINDIARERKWSVSSLRDINSLKHSQEKITKSKETLKDDGKYPYYGAAGIIGYTDYPQFDGKYVLVSRVGSNLVNANRFNVFKVSGGFSANSNVHILKPKETILSENYLFYFLNLIDLSSFVVGAAQPSISWSTLGNLSFVIPPIEKQQSIVNFIEQRLPQIDDVGYEDWIRTLREEFLNAMKSV